MRHLKAAGLVAGLVFAAGVAQAQTAPTQAPKRYFFVGSDAGGASAIDRDSIRKTGDVAAFDVLVIYRSPVPLDASVNGGGYPRFAHYMVGKREIDCSTNRYREVSGEVFDFSARSLTSLNEAGVWSAMVEGDTTVSALVCRGELPADAVTIASVSDFATAYYAELYEDAARQMNGGSGS